MFIAGHLFLVVIISWLGKSSAFFGTLPRRHISSFLGPRMFVAPTGVDPQAVRIKELTLVVITTPDFKHVLLGMKKRGFGEGKWNGYGGKVEPGETIDAAAARELTEESGVVAHKLEKRGVVLQSFVDNPVSLRFHVYHVDSSKIDGTPVETEEMRPSWFSCDDIPYASMWADDEVWYPLFLSGKCFRGFLIFRGTETMLGHTVEEVSAEDIASSSDWGTSWRREDELMTEAGLKLEAGVIREL